MFAPSAVENPCNPSRSRREVVVGVTRVLVVKANAIDAKAEARAMVRPVVIDVDAGVTGSGRKGISDFTAQEIPTVSYRAAPPFHWPQ